MVVTSSHVVRRHATSRIGGRSFLTRSCGSVRNCSIEFSVKPRAGGKILPSIERFSRFNCGEANSYVLCAEADRVFRSSTDEHVREGARLLSECIKRYLQDPTERVFNIEGP